MTIETSSPSGPPPEIVNPAIDGASSSDREQTNSQPTEKKSWRNRLPKQRQHSSSDWPQYEGITLTRGGELLQGATTERGLEVKVKGETVEQYVNFLTTYAAEKAAFSEDILKAMREDPEETYAYDLYVLDKLTDEIKDTNGKVISREVNIKKVEAFLGAGTGQVDADENPVQPSGIEKNWAMATMLLEQDRLIKNLALGAHEVIKSSSYLKKGKGKDSLTGRRTQVLHDQPKSPTLWRGLRAAGLGAAIIGGATGRFLGTTGFTKIESTTDADIIEGLKNGSAIDKAYLKAAGFDVDKVTIDTVSTSPVEVRPLGGGLSEFTEREIKVATYEDGFAPNRDAILANHRKHMAAREAFLTQLGIDPSRIRLPEEFVMDDDAESEGIATKYYTDIMQEYGTPPADATKYDKLHRIAMARSKVMTEYFKKQITIERAQRDQATEGEAITSLEAKQKAMEDPEFRTGRKKEYEETKQKATAALEATTKKKTEMLGAMPELTATVITLQDTLAQKFDISPGGDFELALRERILQQGLTVQRAEALLSAEEERKGERLLQELAPLDEIYRNAVGSQQEIARAVATSGAELKGGINVTSPDTSKLAEGRKTAVNALFDRKIAELQRQFDAANTALQELEKDAKTYQEAVNKRDQATNTLILREGGQLQAMQSALVTFTEPNGINLSVDDVRTLPIAELVNRLNPGNDKQAQQKALEQALLARGEALALQQERERPVPLYQQNALDELTAATGLAPDVLATQSLDDIRNILVAAGTDLNEAQIRQRTIAAKIAAKRMMQVRYQTRLDGEISHYESLIAEQNKNIEELGDFKNQREEIGVTVEIMKDLDDIYDRTSELSVDSAKYRALSDESHIDSDDATYSPAERDQERQHVEWFHLLYPKAINATNREELYRAFARALPPEELRRLSYETTGSMTTQEWAKFLINYMRDRALAL